MQWLECLVAGEAWPYISKLILAIFLGGGDIGMIVLLAASYNQHQHSTSCSNNVNNLLLLLYTKDKWHCNLHVLS